VSTFCSHRSLAPAVYSPFPSRSIHLFKARVLFPPFHHHSAPHEIFVGGSRETSFFHRPFFALSFFQGLLVSPPYPLILFLRENNLRFRSSAFNRILVCPLLALRFYLACLELRLSFCPSVIFLLRINAYPL